MMKTKILVLFFIAACALNSCSVDKCDVDCNSGPLSLNFQLLDKTIGENLFTNGTFDPTDIQVLDLDSENSNVQFIFNTENDRNIISLGPFGWGNNNVNYILKIEERAVFTLKLDAEQKTEDCCSFVAVNNLEIKNTDYELNSETGIYEILVAL
ncbi:hypothetical protein [Aequorivita capsosiphonis]|uniref:hypothetical protein n=1 Tax=Aequorivita capsosiphonis TaxID=487317 RepID=UPI0012FB0F9D|nr:hypothetical protein [Aequorivita capsosiphonis]